MKEKSQLLGKSCLAEQLLLFTYLLTCFRQLFQPRKSLLQYTLFRNKRFAIKKNPGKRFKICHILCTYKKTQVIFFFFFISWNFTFFLINALMTKGKQTRAFVRGMVKNFVEFFLLHTYLKNYFSGSWNISLDANLLFLKFLKSVHTYHEILKLQQTR